MKIKDLVVGQKASLQLVLASADIRKTKGNPPRDFLSATLSDGNDQLDGKIWNYNADLGVPETGKVYDVVGIVGEYQGKKQITLQSLPLSSNQDMTPFMPCYDEEAEKVYDAALELIETISHPDLKSFTLAMYQAYPKGIVYASSAKGVHHCGYGGNLVHSLQVAYLAEAICNVLSQRFDYRDINRDLCVAGGLLHDIGKIYTYTVDGAVIDYTEDGRLEDHTLLGIRMVDSMLQLKGYDVSAKWVKSLLHIIASHHGELEYGAIVNPIFLEAYIVNWADGISATTDTIWSANQKAIAEGKQYTDKLWTCHNREHILQKDVM